LKGDRSFYENQIQKGARMIVHTSARASLCNEGFDKSPEDLNLHAIHCKPYIYFLTYPSSEEIGTVRAFVNKYSVQSKGVSKQIICTIFCMAKLKPKT
jgi:hypothetical protein